MGRQGHSLSHVDYAGNKRVNKAKVLRSAQNNSQNNKMRNFVRKSPNGGKPKAFSHKEVLQNQMMVACAAAGVAIGAVAGRLVLELPNSPALVEAVCGDNPQLFANLCQTPSSLAYCYGKAKTWFCGLSVFNNLK